MKPDEEILREELRALRDIILKLYQWGVTFLASLQAALYFIRKDALNGDIQAGILPANTRVLPACRFLRGTFFLLLVAVLFTVLCAYVSRRIKSYRQQMESIRESKIQDPPSSRPLAFLLKAMFFVFPALDLVYRFLL